MTARDTREFLVTEAESGQRLDRVLAARLEISRVAVKRLLEEGGVRRDGRPLTVAAKGEEVAAGDLLSVIRFLAPRDQAAMPEPDAALVVLGEGEGWVAIDKPAGRPVHPLRQDETGTVLNAVIARWPQMQGVGEGGLRSGITHRLDTDTSGALLLATTQPAWDTLRGHFAHHTMAKTYRAIVLGDLREDGAVELPLRVAQGSQPARVEVDARGPKGGRACGLAWRRLAPLRGATLVEVRPVTGFLHQVRVTLAHLGFPLAGDRLYGPPAADDPTGAARHMLHAARLAWDDQVVESADAADFAALLAGLQA